MMKVKNLIRAWLTVTAARRALKRPAKAGGSWLKQAHQPFLSGFHLS